MKSTIVKLPKERMIEGADLIQALRKMAETKAIKVVDTVTETIVSPKTDTLIKKATVVLVMALGSLMAVNFLLLAVRWLAR